MEDVLLEEGRGPSILTPVVRTMSPTIDRDGGGHSGKTDASGSKNNNDKINESTSWVPDPRQPPGLFALSMSPVMQSYSYVVDNIPW